jgi:prepilin-type N-terminal cleavage/methylation domain-containing protein
MIHFKNRKNGFTLIEVIISLAIVGVILTPVFMLHEMIMNRVNRSAKEFEYMLLCKNLLFSARQKQTPQAQEFLLEKAEIDFNATLTYALEKGVNQKSSLASLVGLHREIVTVSWTDLGTKKQDRLVTFIYKTPEQKKS